MSRRVSITKALADKFKGIDATVPYTTNLYENAHAKQKFWDEIHQFPAIYVIAGTEVREYLPADFTWSFLNVSVKVYCKGENAQEELEALLEDVELCVDSNRVLEYDANLHYTTTEILIQSITTDEGLLAPYAVGEINLQVRYAIM